MPIDCAPRWGEGPDSGPIPPLLRRAAGAPYFRVRGTTAAVRAGTRGITNGQNLVLSRLGRSLALPGLNLALSSYGKDRSLR